MSQTLLATLGTEPQVVTIAMDLLAQQQVDIGRVVVIHTDATCEPSLTSLRALRQEIALLQQTAHPQLRYDEVEIRHDGRALADIEDERGAMATFHTIYRATATCKQAFETVHLCIAGGRKTMSVYGMTTAQLLFDADDRLWHLVSFGDLLKERRMHPRPGDQVRLVPIPIIRWSGVPPALTEIGRLLDPEAALTAVARRQDAEYRQRLHQFVTQVLTPAEQAVARLAVEAPDMTYRQIGLQLQRTHKTIDSQLQAIYRKLEAAFDLEQVTRPTLVQILRVYRWPE